MLCTRVLVLCTSTCYIQCSTWYTIQVLLPLVSTTYSTVPCSRCLMHSIQENRNASSTHFSFLFLTCLPVLLKDSDVHSGVTGGFPREPYQMRGHSGHPLPFCFRQYPLALLSSPNFISPTSVDTLWLNRFSSTTSTSR